MQNNLEYPGESNSPIVKRQIAGIKRARDSGKYYNLTNGRIVAFKENSPLTWSLLNSVCANTQTELDACLSSLSYLANEKEAGSL